MNSRIENPRNCGFFKTQDARGMELIVVSQGSFEQGLYFKLYVLVDPSDGLIVDAKFQVFGPAAMIALLDCTIDLIIHKNFDQAKRCKQEVILKQLTDRDESFQYAEKMDSFFPPLFLALEEMASLCHQKELPSNVVTPLPQENKKEGEYPNWNELSYGEKIALIEKVLEEEIRPYIALDEGGVEILELVNDTTLKIAYKGACTSCFSSVGATLSTIQSILQAKVHPHLTVLPDLDGLQIP